MLVKKVLNVGGNSKSIPIPSIYNGWEHLLLDIDPKSGADIVKDARELLSSPGNEYNSIYCSHNLEHYYRHDALKVLAGFRHVLKNDGFIMVTVPDIGAVMNKMVKEGLDIDDFLYQSAAGPITIKDVIYGYGKMIEDSGNDFFSHKNGFTQKSLRLLLKTAGFEKVYTIADNLEITAVVLTATPTAEVMELLDLPAGE